MSEVRHRTVGALRVDLIDAACDLGTEAIGEAGIGDVLICGEAATLRSARLLLRAAPRLLVLNDAGVGKDGAGVAGLARLADVGLAAVAITHDSARIGDPDDMLENGRVAHLNRPARALGLTEGPLLEQLASRAITGGEPATESGVTR